jgi:hypothetical protein
MASTFYFAVPELVWFYDTENPTSPNPAPGVTTAETGENDFTVEITLADTSTQIIEHVGAQVPGDPPSRWIELRSRDAGEIGG